jgi:hypothetical protein
MSTSIIAVGAPLSCTSRMLSTGACSFSAARIPASDAWSGRLPITMRISGFIAANAIRGNNGTMVLPEARSVLDPFDRVSEVIFGVLMAMTFIGTMNVATAGREEVRSVMIAALGCNVAWGLTDGVMYLVGIITERTRERTLAAAEGRASQAPAPRLRAQDYKSAVEVFILVTASTFPLVVPFFFMRELAPALAASRLIAVAMLFIGGWMLARHAGGRPLVAGLAMAAVGAVLIGALIALGG